MQIPNLREVVRTEIHKTTNEPLNKDGAVNLPAMMIPSFRMLRAREMGVENNFLIRTHGGLGDVICAEPAIRWALNNFKGAEITLDTYFPELFGHLELKEINDTKKRLPEYDKYIVFDTLYTEEVIHWEFIAHMFTQVVDHHSITMWKSQLPIADRCIVLHPSMENYEGARFLLNPTTDIVIHAGRTWQSRTVPSWFWNEVISNLVSAGARPVLIGKESLALVGNLKVDTDGCLDLRDKLSVMETVALLHEARVVLTNDSSPIHMAASGDAHIGFISTVKHPEFITHWRKNEVGEAQFGWRMKNFSSGGVWQLINMCPNHGQQIKVDVVDQSLVDGWMPKPEEFAEWALTKIRT